MANMYLTVKEYSKTLSDSKLEKIYISAINYCRKNDLPDTEICRNKVIDNLIYLHQKENSPHTIKPKVVNKPTSATNEPTSAANKPTSATNKPTSATSEPTSAANKPTSAASKPTSAASKPTFEDFRPSLPISEKKANEVPPKFMTGVEEMKKFLFLPTDSYERIFSRISYIKSILKDKTVAQKKVILEYYEFAISVEKRSEQYYYYASKNVKNKMYRFYIGRATLK